MMNDGHANGCPFCTFAIPLDHDIYDLLQHVELCHPENGVSPFISGDNVPAPRLRGNFQEYEEGSRSSTDVPSEYGDHEEDDAFIECPNQCGEVITVTELPSHMELHATGSTALNEADQTVMGDRLLIVNGLDTPILKKQSTSLYDTANPASSSSEKKHRSRKKQKDRHGLKDWKELWLGSPSKKSRAVTAKVKTGEARRLGRAELGPHAHEKQMPPWLLNQLERGAKITVVNQIGPNGQLVRMENVANEIRGVVPVLAQLCEQDSTLSNAYLCHPEVTHVVKMVKEGGFCGYRNIQMMISFIQATHSPGYEHFSGRIPSIFQLQDMIEAAWDIGINTAGRVETGGIKGTRKYIGTPEAQALLLSLEIGCEATAFNTVDKNPIHENVLHAVGQYFLKGVSDPSQKVRRTSLPPIYFQHPGHSLTIVGLEKRKSGALGLLVLDPMFKTSPGVCHLIGSNFRSSAPERLLKAYRRGSSYLQKYSSFEILKLTSRPAPGPGWNA